MFLTCLPQQVTGTQRARTRAAEGPPESQVRCFVLIEDLGLERIPCRLKLSTMHLLKGISVAMEVANVAQLSHREFKTNTTTGTIVAVLRRKLILFEDGKSIINYYVLLSKEKKIVSEKRPKIIRSALVESKLWSFTGSLISRITFMRPKVRGGLCVLKLGPGLLCGEWAMRQWISKGELDAFMRLPLVSSLTSRAINGCLLTTSFDTAIHTT